MTQEQWLQLVTPANAMALNIIFVILIIWSLIWKGVALWKAARQEDKVWFVVLLVLNTVGLLEILYIFVFSQREKVSAVEKPNGEESLKGKPE